MLACQPRTHTEAVWAKEWQGTKTRFDENPSIISPGWRAKKRFEAPVMVQISWQERCTLSGVGKFISLLNFLPCYLSLSYWLTEALFILRTWAVIYVTRFFCHLVIYFVALWPPKHMGVLVAYIFSLRVSGTGALLREEAFCKAKLYFSVSPYHLFGIFYGLFFILRSHIHLKVCIAIYYEGGS